MKAYLLLGLRVALAILCLSSLLLAQRSDRGIITGLVTDQTSSSVSRATVKVRNEETAVETALTTNDAGAYTTPPLVLGSYSVIVERFGFKTSVNSGIARALRIRRFRRSGQRSGSNPDGHRAD